MAQTGFGEPDSPAVQGVFQNALGTIAKRLGYGSGDELALEALSQRGELVDARTGEPVHIHKVANLGNERGQKPSSEPISPASSEDTLVETCMSRNRENIEEVRSGSRGPYHTYLGAEGLLRRLENPDQAHSATYYYIREGLGEQRCQKLFRDICEEMSFTIDEARKIMDDNKSAYQQELDQSSKIDDLHKK